jgi:hypothetical protein
MARKHCPACNLVCGASAATCSRCGHEFAPGEPTATSPGVRRCLECGLTSPGSARICQCGADLEIDPAEVRGLIAQRRSHARGLIVGSVLLAVFGVVAFVVVAMVSGLVSIIGIGVTVSAAAKMYRTGSRILYAANTVSAELDGKAGTLPRAQLRKTPP